MLLTIKGGYIMMIEYLVFFGLLLVGLISFILHKPGEPIIDYVTEQRLKCESPIERQLYNVLVTNGYYVQTQVPCGKYRIDMALPSLKIAIEADGKAYHSTPAQRAHDRRKNAYLRANGWRVLRFSGRQINHEMRHVLARIQKEASRGV
jgi:very-short-patch-repair endonuclease